MTSVTSVGLRGDGDGSYVINLAGDKLTLPARCRTARNCDHQTAGTTEGAAVAAQMHALPVDDFFAERRVREDGHLIFLAEVKAPSESIAPRDYYKIRRIIPAQEAARPPAQSKCAPIGDHFQQKRLVAGGVRA